MKIESLDGKFLYLDQPITAHHYWIRLKRAVIFFIFGMAMALISVLIPILHFILVPGFIIYALSVAYIKLNEKWSVDISGSKCPSCLNPLSEKIVYFKTMPGRIYCYECRTQLRILNE